MIDAARDALDKLGSSVHALDAIGKIAKQAVGSDGEIADALSALHIIAVIVEAVRAGFEGKLSAKAVEEEIISLRKTVLENDAATDKALDEKFDRG